MAKYKLTSFFFVDMVYVQLMDLFIFSKCYVSIVFNFISSYFGFDLKLT